MTNLYQIDAAKLRAARRVAGLTTAAAVARASGTGLAAHTYRIWENRSRPPITRFEFNVVLDVARVLGVTPEQITSPYTGPTLSRGGRPPRSAQAGRVTERPVRGKRGAAA